MRLSFALAAVLLTTALPAWPQTPTDDTNSKLLNRFGTEIKGRENEPAGQVFRNVQYLKDVNAATPLAIMDIGYSRALGVSCTYCHAEQDFATDEKRPKRAAREMHVMHRSFNDQLRKMVNGETPADARSINCTTCHRGRAIPSVR